MQPAPKAKKKERTTYLKTFFLILVFVLLTAIPHYQEYLLILMTYTWGLLIVYLLSAFVILGYRKKGIRVFGYIFFFLLSLDHSITMLTRIVYGTSMTEDMALSALVTNLHEALEMTGTLWVGIPFFIGYYLLLLYLVSRLGKEYGYRRSLRYLWVLPTSAFLILLILGIKQSSTNNLDYQPAAMENRELHCYLVAQEIGAVSCFPVSSYFIGALYTLKESEYYRTYHLTAQEFQEVTADPDAPRIVVLVMGESALKSEMSLYGCREKTTPIADSLRSGMLLYHQAIAPASHTIVAIPLELTCMRPQEGFIPSMLSDNVLNHATRSGAWRTFWISNQGQTGRYDNTVTEIAHYAQESIFTPKTIRNGNPTDGVLIPLLDEVLEKNQSSKHLFIVLHLMGSHSDTEKRYPHDGRFDRFKTGSKARDSYLSSILYTDYILGEVVKRIQDKPSVLIYTSDHAQTINRYGNYQHGDTKEGLSVPLYVWHSNSISPQYDHRGEEIMEPTSTTDLYNIVIRYLGLKGIPPKPANDELLILLSMKTTKPYMSLPDTP